MEKNFFIGQNQLVKASEVAAIQKAGNNNTFYLKQAGKKDSFTLTNKSEIRKEFEEVKSQQGLIGKAWDGFKNLFGMKSGSKHVEEIIKKAEKGEITQEEAKEAIEKYKEGQKTSVDVVADVASGILSVLAFTLAVPTGGASLAIGLGLATAVGAGIKVGVKATDALTTGKEYKGKDLLYDTVTGGINGLLGPITNGVGNTVTATIGKQIFKETAEEVAEQAVKQGFKQTAKNVILNQTVNLTGGTAAKRALAMGAGMAVDGALGGAADNMTRAALNGENVLKAGVEGAIGGAIMSPIIGGGFNLAGKAGHAINNKITTKIVLPDGIKTKFKQGSIGDCALLSTIDGMMNNPKTAKALKKSITKTVGGDYNVKIGDQIVRVTKDSLSDEVLSDKTGIRIFEQAYKQIAGDIDGGFAEVVAKQFGLKPIHIPQDSITDELLDNLAKNQGETVLSFGTVVDTDGAIASEGQRHYFTIKNIDAENKTVTLTSPVDTSKTIELSYEEVKAAGISIDGGSVKELDLPTVARNTDDTKFKGIHEAISTNSEEFISVDTSRWETSGLPLRYSRQSFIDELNYFVENPSVIKKGKNKAQVISGRRNQLEKILKKITDGRVPVLDQQKRLLDYTGNIDLSKLDQEDAFEKAIYDMAHKFLCENAVTTGVKVIDDTINKVMKIFPEFIDIIGKIPPENFDPNNARMHAFTVDIHTTKVAQNIVSDTRFSSLSPENQEIIMFAALLHDIGKGIKTKDHHSKTSFKMIQKRLANSELSETQQATLLKLIKNHHWFEDYNTGKMSGNQVLSLFSTPEELTMAEMLTRADLLSMNDSANSIGGKYAEALDLQTYIKLKDTRIACEPPIHIEGDKIDIPANVEAEEITPTQFKSTLSGEKKLEQAKEKLSKIPVRDLSTEELIDIWTFGTNAVDMAGGTIKYDFHRTVDEKLCSQPINVHNNEVLVRVVSADAPAENAAYSLGVPFPNGESGTAACARFPISSNGSIDLSTDKVLVQRIIDEAEKQAMANANGAPLSLKPITMYVIDEQGVKGLDFSKYGDIRGDKMGSKTFQRAIDQNGCSTEVVISSKSKFRTKLPVQKSTVTTPYGKVEVNLVYCSVLD